MKKKGKVLALMLSAAALVAASVFGTMAYLTDNEAVTNTFTVGRVGLSLDEVEVNPDGTQKSENRVEKNEYHLLPGYTYIKDPTVHIDEDSEDCWVFVKVDNGLINIEETSTADANMTIAEQMEYLGWESLAGVDNVYYYKKIMSGGDNWVVFKNFTIKGDGVDNDTLAKYKDAKITVTAYAVQAAGFNTAAEAWTAANFPTTTP